MSQNMNSKIREEPEKRGSSRNASLKKGLMQKVWNN